MSSVVRGPEWVLEWTINRIERELVDNQRRLDELLPKYRAIVDSVQERLAQHSNLLDANRNLKEHHHARRDHQDTEPEPSSRNE